MLSFQEHLWTIIKQSLNMAKKKANASDTGIKFVITKDREVEDLNYHIDWLKVVIQGTKEQEEEEYNEAMGMYTPFGKMLKKELPKNESLAKQFNTKVLSHEKVSKAYKEGYGSVSDNNISNKLLEMGILTHIEWVKDYDTRDF